VLNRRPDPDSGRIGHWLIQCRQQLSFIDPLSVVYHTIRAGTHDGFMTTLIPHSIRRCTVWTQHLDDLNDSVLLADDATMDHKPVTLASVHDTSSLRFWVSIPITRCVCEGHKRVNGIPRPLHSQPVPKGNRPANPAQQTDLSGHRAPGPVLQRALLR
jgi:hypothetical protein